MSNKKKWNEREEFIGLKDFGSIAFLHVFRKVVIDIRQELFAMQKSSGRSLNNMVLGRLLVLISMIECMPSYVGSELPRKEAVAWKNIYLEALSQMKANKSQTKGAIENERNFFISEINKLIENLEDSPFYDQDGAGIENPYGEYVNEKHV